MSRFIAIDGDPTQLYVAVGLSTRGSVKLSRAVRFADVPAISVANAAAMGKAFRDRLKGAGIAPAPVVICTGREKVILKDIRYPKPEYEGDEPAIVKFQVIRELSESPDSVVIDYQRLDGEAVGEERKAVAVILKREIVRAWQLFCEAAGLKLLALVPRPFASLAAVRRAIAAGSTVGPESASDSIAVLVRTDKWGELTIARHDRVVFSRSLSSGSLTSESMLIGEIKRNLTVYAGQPGATAVSGLYLAEAADAPDWSIRLRPAPIPVRTFDPLADATHETPPNARGYFAGLVGCGWLESEGLPVNLANPRQPIPPRDPAKRLIAVLGPILALLVVGSLLWGYTIKSAKDAQASALIVEKQSLDKQLERLEQDAKRIGALDEWRGKGINVLDEFYDLTARFPDIASTRVTGISLSPRESEPNAKVKYVAGLEIKVETGNGDAIDALTREMVRDGHFRVAPKEARGPAAGADRTGFAQLFTIKADVSRREPAEYDRYLDAVAPARGKREAGGATDPFGGAMGGQR